MLVDSHCHLNYPEFEGKLDEVLKTANDNNVKLLQTICVKLSEFPNIKRIAETNPQIFCSVGIHPCHVQDDEQYQPVTAEQLIALANSSNKCIGLGETGLDYYREENIAHKDLQQQSFREHILASQETGLPVIVHTRDAEEDTIAIIKEHSQEQPFPFLIHCFTSTDWLAEQAIELGGYISLSGILTFKNAKEIQATAKWLPLDRVLVETDAPYLAPAPHRGKVNQPAYTRHTAEFLADLKEFDYELIEKMTTDNFFNLFKKAYRPS